MLLQGSLTQAYRFLMFDLTYLTAVACRNSQYTRFQKSGAYQKYLVNYQPYFSLFFLAQILYRTFYCRMCTSYFNISHYFVVCVVNRLLSIKRFKKWMRNQHQVPASDWLHTDQSQPPVGGLTFNDGDPPPNQQRSQCYTRIYVRALPLSLSFRKMSASSDYR